ncbi:MAG: patatin-like phospholipase family protein, partial [Pseudomonadota bacterium]
MQQRANGANKPHTVNLALQGGGAHGAFTWGVLDRMLEDGRLNFDGVSGTSAGAMNAVIMADGYTRGGVDGARQALHDYWEAISQTSVTSPIQRSPFDMFTDNWSLDENPFFIGMDLMTRLVSPYQFNPTGLNPLRDIVDERVDFERVRACQGMRVFVSATNVHSGRVKVFSGDELTLDAVMASACLPFLFQAVEIDGVPYWDGGYMGNPVLFPFFTECTARDIVVVQINPVCRQETPKTARGILNRVNEISFNGSLNKELRMVEFLNQLARSGALNSERYSETFLHRIDGGMSLRELSSSSKFNAEWAFLTHLRDVGRACADNWLAGAIDDIGSRSTIDLSESAPRHDAEPETTAQSEP